MAQELTKMLDRVQRLNIMHQFQYSPAEFAEQDRASTRWVCACSLDTLCVWQFPVRSGDYTYCNNAVFYMVNILLSADLSL